MGLFDFVYDWVIHVVPNWLWWVLMVPLFAFLIFILVANYWPAAFSG